VVKVVGLRGRIADRMGMRFRCRSCAAESDVREAFVRGGVAPFRAWRCRPCATRRALQQARRLWVAAAAAALPVLALAIAPLGEVTRYALLIANLVVLPMLFALPSVFVHELAHAVVARALGFDVFRVQIGLGARWRELRLLGLPFELDAPPFGGLTWPALRAERWHRLRYAAVLVAGPATHVAWIAGALALVTPLGDRAYAIGVALTPVPAILLLHGLNLLTILVPSGAPSDVYEALKLPFLRGAALRASLSNAWGVPARFAVYAGRHADALKIVHEGLAARPGDLVLGTIEAVLVFELGDREAGIAALRALGARAGLEPIEGALVANALAWALAERAREEDLAEAEAASDAALAVSAAEPAFLAVKAGVLAQGERHDEAWPLLARAIGGARLRQDRAEMLCALAAVEAKRGRAAAARAALDEARSLGVAPRPLAFAEAALRGAGTSRQNP
jgi:hypothetical protein